MDINETNRKVILAPWRMTYLEGSGMSECFLCKAQVNPDPRACLLVSCDRDVGVVLNRYPYINGHLMIFPRRHVASLIDLAECELNELAFWIKTAEQVIREIYHPDGLNIGINIGSAGGAGLKDHIHVHVMPRWVGDTNFMATCGDTRVIPEALERTFDRISPLFADILNKRNR